MGGGAVVCGWETCGATLQPVPSKKFVRCDECGHMNCVLCRAFHEGVNCAAYQAGQKPAPGPSGSLIEGGPSSPPDTSGPSLEDTCQIQSSANGPSGSKTLPKETSPGSAPRQPGTGGVKKRVFCASEDCGYETMVYADATELPCYKCRHTTCLECNAIHGNITCEQYQRQKVHPSRDVSTSQTQPVLSAPQATSEATEQPEKLLVECCVCMAEVPYDELLEVSLCTHSLCKDCVRTLGVNSPTYVVHCPVKKEGGDHCQSQILESVLESAMTQEEYDQHKELLHLPVQRCPLEDCSGKFSIRPGMKSIGCISCHTEYCVSCSANHPGRTCEQFIESVRDYGAAQQQDSVAHRRNVSPGPLEALPRESPCDATSPSSSNVKQALRAGFRFVVTMTMEFFSWLYSLRRWPARKFMRTVRNLPVANSS